MGLSIIDRTHCLFCTLKETDYGEVHTLLQITKDMNKTKKEKIEILKARIAVLEDNEWFINFLQTCNMLTECSNQLISRYNFTDLQVEGVLNMSFNMLAKAPIKRLKKELDKLQSISDDTE